MNPPIDLLLLKLRARHDLGREEEAALKGMRCTVRPYGRGELMVSAGQDLDTSILLLSGFAVRSKTTADGMRQIVETNIAGDFVDLHGFILRRLEHDISAAGPCEVALVPHGELRRVTDDHPRLTRALWFLTLVDASIHREWMIVLGKKRSRARIAQFFCEMHARLSVVGLVDGNNYALPFNQVELADITGMTPVHFNRSLKELRDAGMVSFRNGRVTLMDLERLKRSAQFDPAYLHLGPHDI